MAEPDDELDALRRADPLDPAAVPSRETPAARALFERITMSDTQTTTTPTIATDTRRRWVLAAAAAVIAVAAVGLAVRAGDDEPADQPGPGVATDSTLPEVTTGGAITPGGMAMCVELYSLDTLATREVAFDGTVDSVEGDAITFTVNEWYRGGEGPAATRLGASSLGGLTSAGPAVDLTPGTRLLVAGDDEFAWGCGFTQAYDPAVAADWAAALAG